MSEYQFFNRTDRKMFADFKEFVVNVKMILFYHENQKNYTITTRNFTTNDQVLIRKTVVSGKEWIYKGLHFDNEFLARSGCFMFHGVIVWEMERTEEKITHPSCRGAVNECLREALSNFDIDNPWHRPECFVSSNNLQYLSRVVGKRGQKIILEEAVRDPYGLMIYATRCEAGFVK